MASWFHGADEYALKLVRAKARKYLGRYGLTAADVEDMQQELLLHLHFAMKKYDPSRGERTTFMDRVVQKRILSIIRYKTASPRDYRKEAHSLNEPAPGDTSDSDLTWGDCLDEETYLAATAQGSVRSVEETRDLAIDTEAALGRLPPELREFCLRLTDAAITALARELDMPRTTLYERIKRIREALREAGIDDYL